MILLHKYSVVKDTTEYCSTTEYFIYGKNHT